MNKLEKVLLALILVGAMALTFFYLRQFHQTPYGRFLMVDAKIYHQRALQILQEGGLGKGVFYQAPLYPYILAGIYKIFGVKIWLVQAIQGGLFLLAIGLLFQISKILFDPRTGLVSAALAVLYGPFVYYSGLLLKESWSIFFTCGLLLILIKAARTPTNRLFYGSGLLLGVNLALRENYILVLIALCLWTFSSVPPAGTLVSSSWTARTSARMRPALFLMLGVFTFLAPFMIRNYAHSGELILTSYQAGANFYIGNNLQAKGFYTRLDFVRANPEFEEADFRSRAEKIMGRSLSPSEVSRFWFRQSLQAFQDDPWLFPKLLGLRLFLFAHSYEIPDNYDYAFMRSLTPALYAGFIPYGLLLALALMGIYFTRRKDPAFTMLYFFLAGYLLSVILFFVTSRYRVPIVPALIPFGAFMVSNGRRIVRQLTRSGKIFSAAFFFLLLYALFQPYTDPRDFSVPHYKLGIEYERVGQGNQALSHYQRALAYRSDDPRFHLALGRVREQGGDPDQALTSYRKALALDPGSVEGHAGLAGAYAVKGAVSEAIQEYREALRINPEAAEIQNNVGFLLACQGHLQEAITAYQEAIRLNPNLAEAYNNLGVVYWQKKSLSEARGAFQEALKRNPGHPAARANLDRLLSSPRPGGQQDHD
jgi:Flp pilus assembly protein TadD/4-amino-4-deoxy-L-arabinose transferase-like glycosyltransferase